MATEFLPNQPVVFTDYSQQGLNNDTNEWSVLLQGTDTLCIQQKLISGVDSIICELSDLGSELFTTFTFLGVGWVKSVGVEQYSHTGGTPSNIENSGTFATEAYQWYQITFEVNFISGGTVVPYGSNYSLGDTWTGTVVDQLGVYTQYLQCKISGDQFIFYATGDITITNISFKPVGDCFINGWNNWTRDEAGKLCHITGNINPIQTNLISPPLIDQSYYKIVVTISGRTQGTLNVTSDVSAPTNICTGNGTFTRYLAPNSGFDEQLYLTPDNDFDGCVSNVLIQQIENTNYFRIVNQNNVAVSDIYNLASSADPVTIYNDRITWCISFNSVLSGGSPIALPTGCYKILYYDADSGFSYSTNSISYNASNTYEKTKMFYGNCEGEAFGFIFTGAGFSLHQRLPVLQINPKYEIEADEYVTSQGVRSNSTVRKDKLKTLWVDYIDEIAHDAFSTLINCDEVTMDGLDVYFPINDYEPEWNENQKYNTAQVKLDFKFNPASLYNKTC